MGNNNLCSLSLFFSLFYGAGLGLPNSNHASSQTSSTNWSFDAFIGKCTLGGFERTAHKWRDDEMIASTMMATIGTILVLILVTGKNDKRDELGEALRRGVTGDTNALELATPTFEQMKYQPPEWSIMAMKLSMGLKSMLRGKTVLGKLGISRVSIRGFKPSNTSAQQVRAIVALQKWALHMTTWAKHSVKCLTCWAEGVSNATLCESTKNELMARQIVCNNWDDDGNYEIIVEDKMRMHSGDMDVEGVMRKTTREEWVLALQHAVNSNKSVCEQMIAAFDGVTEV